MTKIKIITKKNIVIDIQGHAGYDVLGKDIVCAAISAISQYILLLAYNTDYLVKHTIDDASLKMEIKNCPSTRKWVEVFKTVIWDLKEQYPDYIETSYLDL